MDITRENKLTETELVSHHNVLCCLVTEFSRRCHDNRSDTLFFSKLQQTMLTLLSRIISTLG